MEPSSRQDRRRLRQAQQRTRAQGAGAVVGVDAGKFRHCLVVRAQGGTDSRPFIFPTTRSGFDDAAERVLEIAGVCAAEVLVGIEFAGVYGFTLAHYLHGRGFGVVSVLPADTKAWKSVRHHQRLKTDQADAATITDLVGQGQFVTFPFLKPEYAELRHLVSARERLTSLWCAAVARLKTTLQIVWPEFEGIFRSVHRPTPAAVLRAFPTPEALLAAPKRQVMHVLRTASRNHVGKDTYDRLHASAQATLALPGTLASLKREVHLLLDQVEFHKRQIRALEASMVETMKSLPEAEHLITIPGVAPVAAAIFLGSVGDPAAYHSARQVLKLAGMSLVESSSGTKFGYQRLSKSGKPLLRRLAFMLGLRAVRRDGLFRAQHEAMLARNGGRKLPAVVATGRRMLCLMTPSPESDGPSSRGVPRPRSTTDGPGRGAVRPRWSGLAPASDLTLAPPVRRSASVPEKGVLRGARQRLLPPAASYMLRSGYADRCRMRHARGACLKIQVQSGEPARARGSG